MFPSLGCALSRGCMVVRLGLSNHRINGCIFLQATEWLGEKELRNVSSKQLKIYFHIKISTYMLQRKT